jgi:hypothetical protein
MGEVAHRPKRLVIAEELEGHVIDLEGRDLVVVEVGHTDTGHTTCLHVPSVGLVVAGDVAYNDVHPTSSRELYDKMLELYPDRANPGSLWGSARAVKG